LHEGNMNNLSLSVNSDIEWRRSKVQELASQGYNQSEISAESFRVMSKEGQRGYCK